MLKRPSAHARDPDEIIVYWIIVCQGFRYSAIFGQGEEKLDPLHSFLRFLMGPVFSYIKPVTYRSLEPSELGRVVKVLAWTAPMAALLLKRLAQMWAEGNIGRVWDDYLTAVEADEKMFPSSSEDSASGDDSSEDGSENDSTSGSDTGTDLSNPSTTNGRSEPDKEDRPDSPANKAGGDERGGAKVRAIVAEDGLEATQVDAQAMDTAPPSKEQVRDNETDQDSFVSDDLMLASLAQEEATTNA
ncbi:hypothetical protein QFC21_007320 [Naganishia friedmannii]|uniref:Uncharacterized protein n=2 Tax=Naganishia friedmannii TaxID=89922 RepID=A0ACC2UVM1_9TREE|nr:hypothetical protein QFC21_007357 [Naganishia friedmannii]KAJ9091106.1 hypothetical protein QFC21_007320 [Naganishia friedmannii]